MAAVTTAVVAGVTGAYSIASQEEAKRRGRAAQTEAKDKARKMEREAKERETTEKARKVAVDERSKRLKRQRSMAAEKQGRQGTILAGGETSENLGGGAGKSLLGV